VDDFRPAIGRRVRERRERLGLSQEQLSERAGLHWTYISGVERGRRNPSLNTLARLAKALAVSLPRLVSNLRPSEAEPPRHRR
jgi:transcriptional regulator with XRE-family HTH domain